MTQSLLWLTLYWSVTTEMGVYCAALYMNHFLCGWNKSLSSCPTYLRAHVLRSLKLRVFMKLLTMCNPYLSRFDWKLTKDYVSVGENPGFDESYRLFLQKIWPLHFLSQPSTDSGLCKCLRILPYLFP